MQLEILACCAGIVPNSAYMMWLTTAHVRRYHQHYHSSGHVWQMGETGNAKGGVFGGDFETSGTVGSKKMGQGTIAAGIVPCPIFFVWVAGLNGLRIDRRERGPPE